MSTFIDVAAVGHKGLKRAELHDLGKINVICGPNNSGKTTLLECLQNPQKHNIGLRGAQVDLEKLEAAYMRGHSWNSPVYRQRFKEIAANVFGAEIWYDDKANTIKETIIHLASQRHIQISRSDSLDAAVKAQFRTKPSVVLVSAKRKLHSQVKVDISQEVKPDGEGVLNSLFAAKNSPGISETAKNYRAIVDAFNSITGGWIFDIFLESNNFLQLKFFGSGGSWLGAEDCGLGFRDLIIILYFSLASPAEVILIEEPENHQHPDIQRKLISFLRTKTSKQFFLSTHSNVFSNPLYADRVFSCKVDGEIVVENVTSRASLLASIGYSVADNLISDLVILVEGPSDKLMLDEFFFKLGISSKYTIRIWPLGGDIMGQLDIGVFAESYRVIALIDTDPKSRKIRDEFKKKCTEHDIPVHQLKRYAIENYLSIPAIAKVTHQKIPEGLVALDPKKKVSDQLGFNVKGNAANIVRAMSLDDIKDTDLMEFLRKAEKMLLQK